MTLPASGAAFRDETDEKPLDPAFEKVRRKMVRLLLISIGVMLVGLMAVLLAIVYRTSLAPRSAPAATASQPAAPLATDRTGTIRLPQGATVLSQSVSGGQIALHLRLAEGGEAIFLYDPPSDRVVGRFAIVPDAPK